MYTVTYDPEGWERVGRTQEWRQTVEQELGDGLHLVATLSRGFGDRPRVVAAHIEHRYRTRYEWKSRIVERLSPRDVVIAAAASPSALPIR
jgi:hypothetical protein